MSDAVYTLKIVTPTRIIEKEILDIRLKDKTGFFGILRGHIDFLTILEASLCYYRDKEDREFFLAVDGGVLRVHDGTVTVTSQDVYESDDAEKLSGIIEKTIAQRDESEREFRKTLKSIEQSFLERTMEFIRGSS